LQAGAKDFISKPFDLVEVKTRIHNMLEVRLLYKKLENFNKVLEQTVQERTAELRESEARYRSLTELASDCTGAGRGRKLHQGFGPVLEMLGIRVGALVDEPGGAQVTGWNEAERKELQAMIAARQPFLDFTFSRVNPDGSHQKFRVSGERCSTRPAASSVIAASAWNSPHNNNTPDFDGSPCCHPIVRIKTICSPPCCGGIRARGCGSGAGPMRLGELLYEPGQQLQHAYFPTTAIVSLHYVMESGASAETAGWQ